MFCDRNQTTLARSQAEFGFGALEKVAAAPSAEGVGHSRRPAWRGWLQQVIYLAAWTAAATSKKRQQQKRLLS